MKYQAIISLIKSKSSALPAALLFLIFISPLISENNQPVKPQVLGVYTPIAFRGQETVIKPPPIPVKMGEIDLSKVSAQSVLVYDEATASTLIQKNPDETLGIASITKLLTALVIYNSLDMNEYLTVAPRDTLDVSPSLNLQVGDSIKVFDLFSAMLIGSCNDAALMLANHASEITGASFENLMNKLAQQLGLKNSHFSNPMGFDSVGNFSTAADVRLLVEETQKYSVFAMEGRQQSYSFTSAKSINYRTAATNKLIGQDPEISGIKTGFTNQTGGSMITKANHNGHEIIIIILGSKNREADTKYLKEKVYENFSWE